MISFIANILRKILSFIRRSIDRVFEYPLRNLPDQVIESSPSRIPKNVFQTCEKNLFGKSHINELRKFRSLNPMFSFYIYDGIKRDNYMSENWQHHRIFEIYSKVKFGVMKTDIFRYCVLYDHGGFYFDINKSILVPLLNFYDDSSEAVIAFEGNDNIIEPDSELFELLDFPNKLVVNWGIGFAKGHPLPMQMIDGICDSYPLYKNRVFDSAKAAILSFCGPGKWCKTVHSYIKNNGTKNFAQAGIDFDKKAYLYIKGSSVMPENRKHYSTFKNSEIFFE